MSKIVLKVEGPPEPIARRIEESLSGFPMGRAGELIWLVGECFPAWQTAGDQIEWDVHSPVEIEIGSAGNPTKHIAKSGKMEPMPADMKWFRLWQPSPSKRYESWSVNKSQLDTLEAMYLHQLADTSVATSRLAGAGILYWPTNLPSLPLRDGRPEPGSQEELQEQLSKAMTDSITDRRGADAVVPLVVFGDPTTGENQKPEHVLLERPDDAEAFERRMAAYRQKYATGVELPVESVQGVGTANHWTAWVVKEDKWRFYLAPLANIIVDALTRNYAAPVAREFGYMGPVKVVADGTALISKPDKTDAAIRLAQLGGFLSDEAVLENTGFDPVKDKGTGIRESNGRLQELPVSYRDTSPSG
jgi:hypothetical protein